MFHRCDFQSPNALISQVASVGIEAITGPEVVTGSTRMKAGTAQKIILNMITTTAMIQVGKIFKGYMVDVQPTNQKLKQRASNILAKITDLSPEDARRVLEDNDFDLKVAIISPNTSYFGTRSRKTASRKSNEYRKGDEK